MSEKFTSLAKSKHTIPANSTSTINFLGANPNYYQIVNGGTSDLYVGVSMMPTNKFYDAKVPATSSKLVVDAYGHEQIYIYNPSTSEDINIIVTSFEAEFNPTTIALNGLSFDLANIEMTTESTIKDFECSLPAGTNTIGKVELTGQVPGTIVEIKNSLTAITEGSIKESLGDIVNALCGNSEDDGKLKNVISLLEDIKNKETGGNVTPQILGHWECNANSETIGSQYEETYCMGRITNPSDKLMIYFVDDNSVEVECTPEYWNSICYQRKYHVIRFKAKEGNVKFFVEGFEP